MMKKTKTPKIKDNKIHVIKVYIPTHSGEKFEGYWTGQIFIKMGYRIAATGDLSHAKRFMSEDIAKETAKTLSDKVVNRRFESVDETW